MIVPTGWINEIIAMVVDRVKERCYFDWGGPVGSRF
jgi:hypothetical protein